MRDEATVDSRKLIDTQSGGDIASDKPRDSLAEDRVDQQRQAGQLYQPARMPEPSEPSALTSSRRPREET
jgi:hypothetical protein